MKKLFAILLAAFMLFDLVACNGTENNNASGSTSKETTPEITTPEVTTPETTTPEVTTPEITTPEVTTPPEPEFDEFRFGNELIPIWVGDTVYEETVMFVGTDDIVPLLYPATEIVSITDYTGNTTFVEGSDYILENGMLKMPEGSNLIYCPESTYWSKHSHDVYTLDKNGNYTITMACALYPYQVKVTYKHNSTSTISVPNQSESFKDVIGKLERGEDVTIIFFGDSITEGWDCSLKLNIAPYMPQWSALVVQYLANKYEYSINYVDQDTSIVTGAWNYPAEHRVSFGDRGTINYINTAVGGYTAKDAIAKFDTHVSQQIDAYGCDLLFYAFGMNCNFEDRNSLGADAKNFAKLLYTKSPDTALVIVSSMLYNTEVQTEHHTKGQEKTLKQIAKAIKATGQTVELAPLQSVFEQLDAVKRYRDLSGNNMNHPGDYLQRVYAQVVLQTICGYAEK